MSHLDLAGLTRYDGKIKEYIAGFANWQKTAKAGAVTCWPVGGTPLALVVDYIFTETPPANGEPKAPDNPSTITGVSSVNFWLAGKNINRTMPYYGFVDGVRVVNGVTFTANADGSVTANGLAAGSAICDLYNSNSTPIYGEPIGVGTWTVSGCPSGSNHTYSLQTVISTGYGSSSGYEFGSGSIATITKPGARIGLIIRIPSGYNAQNLVFKPQIELGNEKTSYEQPVEKQNYTIALGNTYYGGSVDLATGVMTMTKEYITISSVTAFDSIQNGTAVCRFWTDSVVSDATETCDKLPYVRSGSGIDRFFIGTNTNAAGQYPIYIILKTSYLDFSGAADPANPTKAEVIKAVNTYLASNPLHVVATRKEPATIQLSPTQIYSLSQADEYTPRLNTIYSDQQSVQVGYAKSPVQTESELTNAIVSLGGNV